MEQFGNKMLFRNDDLKTSCKELHRIRFLEGNVDFTQNMKKSASTVTDFLSDVIGVSDFVSIKRLLISKEEELSEFTDEEGDVLFCAIGITLMTDTRYDHGLNNPAKMVKTHNEAKVQEVKNSVENFLVFLQNENYFV